MNEAPRSLTEDQAHRVRTSTVVPRLARRIARSTSYLTEDDLRSIGHQTELGLAARFDPSRGIAFEAFSFRFVRAELRRAVSEEKRRQLREQTGRFDAADDYLERADDRGNILEDSPAEMRAQAEQCACGILGAVLMQVMSASSIAPSEDELHEHADNERKRARVRAAIEAMGESGRVLALRYLDGHDWETVAARLGETVGAVRWKHDEALPRLVRSVLAHRPHAVAASRETP
jgi:RNA polymerase sigma factor (sigma-70 family)